VISSADGKFFDQATKRTFPELSMAGPALEVYDGQVFIAWTGVDGRGTLNLMSARNGLDFGNKLILKDRHSIDESPSLAATLSSTAPVETRLHIGWTERGTNKVLFAEVMFNGGFVNNLDGFIFSAAGNPPYRGRQDVFSSVPPSLAGSFSLNVAWIAGNEHHVVWSASDLSSPGLGGLWSAPIEFKDSTDQPPALLADALNRPKIAWRGLDDKHSINTADMANMPTA